MKNDRFITLPGVDGHQINVISDEIIAMQQAYSEHHGASVIVMLNGGHRVVVKGTLLQLESDFPAIFKKKSKK